MNRATLGAALLLVTASSPARLYALQDHGVHERGEHEDGEHGEHRERGDREDGEHLDREGSERVEREDERVDREDERTDREDERTDREDDERVGAVYPEDEGLPPTATEVEPTYQFYGDQSFDTAVRNRDGTVTVDRHDPSGRIINTEHMTQPHWDASHQQYLMSRYQPRIQYGHTCYTQRGAFYVIAPMAIGYGCLAATPWGVLPGTAGP